MCTHQSLDVQHASVTAAALMTRWVESAMLVASGKGVAPVKGRKPCDAL